MRAQNPSKHAKKTKKTANCASKDTHFPGLSKDILETTGVDAQSFLRNLGKKLNFSNIFSHKKKSFYKVHNDFGHVFA